MKQNSAVWRWLAVGALVGLGIVIFRSDLPAVWREPAEVVVERLRSLGPWTVVVSLLLLIVETVIPPIPAAPILVANALIFGVWAGIAISWVGSLMGAVVNFWIARRFGRAYVERRLKPDHLRRVDQISRDKGFQILLLARIFPLTSLDVLSFMGGLSSISFRHYFLATAIGLAPSVTVYTFLSHDLFRAGEYLWRVGLIVGVLAVGYLAYHYRAVLVGMLRQLWTRGRD